VDIYNVNIAKTRIPRVQRFGSFLGLFAMYAMCYFAVEWAIHWLWPRDRNSASALGMLVTAVIWATLMSTVFSSLRPVEYQIMVDEDEISTGNFKSWNQLFSRSIHRGEVKTVIERKKGLLISRHNRIGTFLWGGIWIPKQLDDYEYLKRLISGWG
jgi:membrane-bound metal-dependent hydrolase YbcI (DUF457 family)